MKKNPEQDKVAERLAHPENWVTGEKPMTDAQKAYGNTLAKQVGEGEFPEDLTKAEASQKIDELKQQAGLADTSPSS